MLKMLLTKSWLKPWPKAAFHRISGQWGLEQTSEGHPVHPPARAGCTGGLCRLSLGCPLLCGTGESCAEPRVLSCPCSLGVAEKLGHAGRSRT